MCVLASVCRLSLSNSGCFKAFFPPAHSHEAKERKENLLAFLNGSFHLCARHRPGLIQLLEFEEHTGKTKLNSEKDFFSDLFVSKLEASVSSIRLKIEEKRIKIIEKKKRTINLCLCLCVWRNVDVLERLAEVGTINGGVRLPFCHST